KENQAASLLEVREWDNFKIHRPHRAILSDPYPFLANGLVLLLRLLDGSPQRKHQTFPRHLQHLEARVAAARFQKRTGVAPELQDLQLGVNQHAGRGKTVERDAVRLALRIDVSGKSLRRAGRFGSGDFFLLSR